MKLLNLTIQEEFRSLHKGFSIDFHKNLESMDTFQPFCFAGADRQEPVCHCAGCFAVFLPAVVCRGADYRFPGNRHLVATANERLTGLNI